VLQDIEVILPEPNLYTQQSIELKEITDGCVSILENLQRTLNKYGELKSDPRSVGLKMKRIWKRLQWEPEDIKELRSRIVINVTLLDTFQGKITK
jgi:hypothetical protein